jgi:peptidoglycan/xylan/chitin deacetylase (PgdA/CDA1 family)
VPVFLYVVVPFLHGKYLRLLLGNKATKSKALVLKFDDGSGSRLTAVILHVLAKDNVRAKFFSDR